MAWLASVNWSNVGLIALGGFAVLFGYFRVERKARWIALLFLVIPSCCAILIFGYLGQHLAEMWIGVGLAIVLYALWHILYGHRLPEPSSDNIRVWGQED